MQQLAQLGINLPKDMTPAKRALLKAYWHIGAIAFTHAILATIVLMNQSTVVKWQYLVYSFGGQFLLALIDCGKKYVTSKGDIPLSALLAAGSNQLQQYVPDVPLDPTKQAIEQQVTSWIQPTPDMTATQSFNAAPPTQSSTIRYTANAQLASQPVQSLPPVQPAVDPNYHPAISASDMLNTFPGIPAIGKPQ